MTAPVPEDHLPIVDVHAHTVLEGVFGSAGEHGPELVEGAASLFRSGGHQLHGVRYRDSVFMDVDARLRAMDEVGIDRQLLSPNPLYYFHHIDPATAIPFAIRHNDLLAALVEDQPRLDGLALLPLQDPEAACAELERAVGVGGLCGAYVGSRSTRELDDPAFDELWATFVDLDVPLFLHPAPDAVDAPSPDPRYGRWDLDLILGFAHDETMAVATLVYGGVLQRFPSLQVCVSHGGGATPYLVGRMASAARRRPWSPEWLRPDGAFEEQVSRLWFDGHVQDDRARRLLVEVVGEDRVVFGTNFGGWDQRGITVAPREAPIHVNTRRLLGMADTT